MAALEVPELPEEPDVPEPEPVEVPDPPEPLEVPEPGEFVEPGLPDETRELLPQPVKKTASVNTTRNVKVLDFLEWYINRNSCDGPPSEQSQMDSSMRLLLVAVGQMRRLTKLFTQLKSQFRRSTQWATRGLFVSRAEVLNPWNVSQS